MHLKLLSFHFDTAKSEFEGVEEVIRPEVLKRFGVECSWV